MMGYVPDLHQIWVGTADEQLIALSHEFPGFYRYALLMEEAFEAERNKISRPYDGMAPLSEPHQQRAARLLSTAATLERGYAVLVDRERRSVSSVEDTTPGARLNAYLADGRLELDVVGVLTKEDHG